MAAESRFLKFEQINITFTGPDNPVWNVQSKTQRGSLGNVAWYPRWRRFVFEPNEGCIYDAECLRDIAAFCDTETRAEKQRRKPGAQAVVS